MFSAGETVHDDSHYYSVKPVSTREGRSGGREVKETGC